MNWKRTLFSLAIGLAVLAIGLIFFGSKKVDISDLEGQLTTLASDNFGVPEDKISVDCPDDDVDAKEGETIDCDADVGGKPIVLAVVFTDDDGHFRVTPSRSDTATQAPGDSSSGN